MDKTFRLKKFSFAFVFLALQISTALAQTAAGNELAPSQIIKVTDMTAEERAYYNNATDPVVKKNFIITRSYVRLAQKVVDKKMPASQFPASRPKGFSVAYLLPDDPSVINQAQGMLLAVQMRECFNNPKCPK
jgi:hypothetical protein